MAEVPSSLGDFFAKKNKKKVKGLNLNNATADKKDEDKKPEKKKGSKEDQDWQEEEVVQSTMKVGAAGNLIREEEKKEEEESSGPAWGKLKIKSNADINEKRFPTLAKSVAAIDMEDNSQKINISTSKNMFANLEDDNDSEEEKGPKRPKEIKPAMVTKKKGEKHQDAVEREVGKYKPEKSSKGNNRQNDEDEEEEDVEEKAEKQVKAKKKKEVKVQKSSEQKADDGEAEDDDVKIQADLTAAKAKYAKRRRLQRKELPASEMEEEKENKPVPQNVGKSKKKWAVTEEEDTERKMQYLED